MDNKNTYRNITLSTKVSAAQKAEYLKIAASHGVSPSEWMVTIIETNKNSYGKAGDPTQLEIKQKRENELVIKQKQKMKAQRDTSDEFAASMQERSNKAILERDEANYALKVALVEIEKYKSRLKIAESMIGSGRPKETNNKSLITTISVGMTTILAIMLFGRRFS